MGAFGWTAVARGPLRPRVKPARRTPPADKARPPPPAQAQKVITLSAQIVHVVSSAIVDR
jgi:hypothetical protein